MKRLKKKIRIRKHKKVVAVDSSSLLLAFLQRSYDFLPENVKKQVLYAQASKEKKAEARKLGYKPYGD